MSWTFLLSHLWDQRDNKKQLGEVMNMEEKIFEYPALLVRQGPGAPPLVLFSASAVEIDEWVGIPRKTRIVDGETLGFQRDDNPDRVDQIAKFYSEPNNVIHNPLLCAIRQNIGIDVSFAPVPGDFKEEPPAVAGTLTIKAKVRAVQSLSDLFRDAREALEQRVPELADRQVPETLVSKLRMQSETVFPPDPTDQDNEEDSVEGTEESMGSTNDINQSGEEALFEESHVAEFWSELRAREILLDRLGNQFEGDEFVGFGRDAVEAYLRPVILVDGQHRLLGALQAARTSLNSDPHILTRAAELLDAGTATDAVEKSLLVERARRLPISMLLDANPGEHVFQFVVVNQKATPVRPALLATIISTSLSETELEPITERLENAGIPLKSSRAISFFARHPSSPFAMLVTRGFENEGSELLPWTVLGQLVGMFRDLRGARYFHDGKLDYADAWRRRRLEASKITDGATNGTAYDAWRGPDGPWKDVFIAFWGAVRDTLGCTNNHEAYNYWGRPRTSNLFNKPSLLTLATDFFAYIYDARRPIDSAEGVKSLVEEWLLDVDRNYFARDWKLSGVKKDAAGSRKQWSKIWYGYRRDPRRLPELKQYSTLYKEG